MTQTNIGWTAQSPHGWVHDEGTPSNVFTEEQLPDPEIQKKANIDPDKYRNQPGFILEPVEVSE